MSGKYDKIGWLFIALWSLASCRTDNRQFILQKAAERVNAFKAKKMEECRATLLNEASEIVDSVLLQEARFQLNDSLARARPVKPFQPPPLAPIDTQSVRPFFK